MSGSLKRGFGISDYAECSQRFAARLKYVHLDAYRGKLRPILPLLETLNGIIHRNIYKMATRKQHESLFGILELTNITLVKTQMNLNSTPISLID